MLTLASVLNDAGLCIITYQEKEMETYFVDVRGYVFRVAARSASQALATMREMEKMSDSELAKLAADDRALRSTQGYGMPSAA